MERGDLQMPWSRKRGGGYRKKGAPRGKGGFISRPKQYEALRKKGMSKREAAAISNKKKKGRKKK